MKRIQALTFTGTFALALIAVSACGETDGPALLQGGSGGRVGGSAGQSADATGGRAPGSGGRTMGSGGRAGGATHVASGGDASETAGAAGEDSGGAAGADTAGAGATARGGSSNAGGPSSSGGMSHVGGANAGGAAGAAGAAEAGAAGSGGAGNGGLCPIGVPANKAACEDATSCAYPNMICVCGEADGQLRWTCTMQKCPPKAPSSGTDCKMMMRPGPVQCEYDDGAICSCDMHGQWQCTP
ncbi:MAG TPA: hypothetical protein VFQ61_01035 [Polyangiaceae bacterium]|nr:hypothetical protein [Polyangiaceae bacterium]